jgi:hypothetical protein
VFQNKTVLFFLSFFYFLSININKNKNLFKSLEYSIGEERKGARGAKMLFSLLMKAELGEKE